MENLSWKSAWRCSRHIRDFIYEIIFSIFPHVTSIQIKQREDHGSEMKSTRESPKRNHTATLADTYKVAEKTRLKMFFKACNLVGMQKKAAKAMLKEGDKNGAILMAIMFCWINSAEPSLKKR